MTLLLHDVLKLILLFDKVYVFEPSDKMIEFKCWDHFLLCVCIIRTVKTYYKISTFQ